MLGMLYFSPVEIAGSGLKNKHALTPREQLKNAQFQSGA